MSRWTESFHHLGVSYMMKNRPPEFGVMSDYIYTFSEKLGVMDRISQRIMKEQYGIDATLYFYYKFVVYFSTHLCYHT